MVMRLRPSRRGSALPPAGIQIMMMANRRNFAIVMIVFQQQFAEQRVLMRNAHASRMLYAVDGVGGNSQGEDEHQRGAKQRTSPLEFPSAQANHDRKPITETGQLATFGFIEASREIRSWSASEISGMAAYIGQSNHDNNSADAMRCGAPGALAVEMEAAALYAFATAENRSIVCLAHVTSTMAQTEGDFGKGEADDTMAILTVAAVVAQTWLSTTTDAFGLFGRIFVNRH